MPRYRRSSGATRSEVQEKLEKMMREFAPFLDSVKPCGKRTHEYMQFKKDAGKLYKKIHRAENFVRIISEMKSSIISDQAKAQTLVKLLGYLGLVESIGTAMVDFGLVLLILNNRFFHIESTRTAPSIRHATSLKDFEDEFISLGAKLGFLEKNGLASFAKMIKRTLRNRIAHLKFDIDDSGNAFYRSGNRRKNVDIDSEIQSFYRTVAAFRRFLLESGMLKLMAKATSED